MMKRKLLTYLLTVTMVASSIGTGNPMTTQQVMATEYDENYDEEVPDPVSSDGYEYRLTSSDSVKITGYVGDETELVIPSEIEGYTVDTIGDFAFNDNEEITSVAIPDTVTWIGESAFYYCTNLTNVTFGEEVEYIDEVAFGRCTSLREMQLPEKLTELGNSAFVGCTSLTTINIPQTLQELKPYVFGECTSLEYVELHDEITTIGSHAFDKCTNLVEIYIPKSVTELDGTAFFGCSNMRHIEIDFENEKYILIDGILYSKDNKNLLWSLPQKTGEIIVLDGVEKIHEYAFYENENITYVQLPKSTTDIGQYAFYACSSLEDIVLSENIEKMGDYAFSGCSSLEQIEISGTMEYVCVGIFSECDNLKYVTLPDTITEICDYAFSGCNDLKEVNIPSGVTKIGMAAFENCASLKKLEIPDILQVNSKTFSGCSSLEEINIPETADYISECAFENCSSLTNITIPESVVTIEWNAFGGCTNVTKAIIKTEMADIFGPGIAGLGYENAEDEECDYPMIICYSEFSDAYRLAQDFGYPYQLIDDDSDEDIDNGDSDDEDSDFIIPGIPEGGWRILETNSIKLNETSFVYTGSAIMPKVTVMFGNEVISEETDYDVFFENNVNAGTASVTVVGTGRYLGTFTKNFTINKATQQLLNLKNYNKTIDDGIFALGIKVKNGDGKLSYASSDMEVASVDENGIVTINNAGTCKITVTAAETNNAKKATGTIVINVKDNTIEKNSTKTNTTKIKSAKTKVTKLKSGKKKLTVKWKKKSNVAGYEIQYSTSKKFKKKKTVTKVVKKAKTTKLVLIGLKKGKKYYVRIRTYSNAKVGKKTIKVYSNWSKAKSSEKVK